MEGFLIVMGGIDIVAAAIYIWLCTKWGKKWLKQL